MPARLLADEDFPLEVVRLLRELGHDVLTVSDLALSNAETSDEVILQVAIENTRTVLTHDHRDYWKLHRSVPNHPGIISCTRDQNWSSLAARIHEAVAATPTAAGRFVRIVRPNLPKSS